MSITNNYKLPISLGILSWKSRKSIKNSLNSYINNGLFDIIDDVTIFFQEFSSSDAKLSSVFNIHYISSAHNIGIGKAFLQLAQNASSPYILLLEHDWQLLENKQMTFLHLKKCIDILTTNVSCVRLRHRFKYGYPHYSIKRYRGSELNFFDEWIQLYSPHLLDCVHWKKEPHVDFPDKIFKLDDFFVANSMYANWTNNPCLFKRDFYAQTISNFVGDGIDLEKNISYWWARQNYFVAQGKGLFMHNDIDKYGFFQRNFYKFRL